MTVIPTGFGASGPKLLVRGRRIDHRSRYVPPPKVKICSILGRRSRQKRVE
jgi:hypothetical protein